MTEYNKQMNIFKKNNKGKCFEDGFYQIILNIFLVSQIAFIDYRRVVVPVQYLFIVIFSIRFLRKKSKFTLYAVWSLAFLMISFHSIFYSIEYNYSFYLILTIGQMLVFCNLMIAYLNENDSNYSDLLDALILSAIVLLLRLIIRTPLSQWGMVRIGNDINYNANTVGLVLSLSSCIAYFKYKISDRIRYLLLCLLLGFFSLFSGSRKAFAVILLFFIIFNMFISSKNIKYYLKNILFSFIFAFIIFYFIINCELLYNVMGRRVESLISGVLGKTTDDSTMTRFNMIKIGLEAIKEKPFFGYGLGAYNFISGYNAYSHNNYIEIGVSLGLVGLLIYYSMHVYIFIMGLKRIFIRKVDSYYYFFSFTMISIILFLDLGLVNYSDEFFHFLIMLSFSGLLHNRNYI